ncbi:MAG: dihydroorotate dehydrogenase electron transfer subunit [Lachnospiraceae bacterium]|nr:dihydroorotate dehydrogenase electron transfer subunit [Lachnospiraceae bacterium]
MRKERAGVVFQEQIADHIYSLSLKAGFAKEVKPGQFVLLYSSDRSRLLPRPISICQVSRETGTIRLVYRIAGEGTREFSGLRPGDGIDILGPVGNGFPIADFKDKKVLLVGGGIGIPPLLGAAYELEHPVFAAGYRSETYLLDDLSARGRVLVATEDGSLGVRGNVLDAIRQEYQKPSELPDAFFACGPLPMLRALAEFAGEQGLPCYVSLEERMACGIGACLGCITKTAGVDGHSKVHNARICTDGPVFRAEEVDWS